MSAFRDDDIGIALGWLDKFQVHGTDSVQILLDHGIGRAPAFVDVPLETADEAQVSIGIHEDLDIEHLAQRGFGEDQNSLHQDDTARLDGERLGVRLSVEKS